MLSACLLAMVLLALETPAAAAQSEQPPPTIALLYGSWNHTQLTVLVDATNASYVRASVQAMRSWETAIGEFGRGYGFPAYAPLAQITFLPYLLGENASLPEYDVTIEILPSAQTESSQVAGLENSTVVNGTITRAQIFVSLAQLGNGSSALGTMQSVIAHELGHALGLGHAQTTADSPSAAPTGREMMFPYADTSEVPTVPSTLDVYALAAKFWWLFSGTTAPSGSTVSLPPSIPYRELGVSLVTIVFLPMALGPSGEPGIVSNWYPEGYQLPQFAFDNISAVSASASGVDYAFQGWLGTGDGAYNGTSPTPRIVVGAGNITEVALWSPKNQLSSTVQGLQEQVGQLQSSNHAQSLDLSLSYSAVVGLVVVLAIVTVVLSRNRGKAAVGR